MTEQEKIGTEKETPGSAVMLKLCWALFGPILLVASALVLMKNVDGRVIWVLCYGLIAVGMVITRYFDQRTGYATTLQGERSTWSQFYRYAVRLGLVGCLLLGVAVYVGTHYPI